MKHRIPKVSSKRRTYRQRRAIGLLFLTFSLLFFSNSLMGGVAAAEDVRAALPASGAMRVENWRGNVRVEVWGEKDVSITAMIDGVAPNSSPVIIARTARLLSISVARQKPGTTPQRVDLLIRLPERSRAEIITSSGEIDVRGVPAELSARTVKGDIRAEVARDSNASVTAETVSGQINANANLMATKPASERRFQTVLGRGRNFLRLRSERGQITLVSDVSSAEIATASEVATAREIPTATPSPEGNNSPSTPAGQPVSVETRQPPTLIGSDGRGTTGAGTPATPFSTPEEIDESDIVRVDTELVTINMSAIDRGTNRGLTGLTQNDFKVYEDGVAQEIAHFDSAAAPFNLVLLIDLSSSTQDVLKLLRESALAFVNAARPADRIGIITFGMVNVVVSPLTSDREELRRRINAIDKHLGSTNLYDALNFALDEVLKDAKDSRRNAIVLMSDGLDSTLPNVTGDGSKIGYTELLGRVREFDGVLYTLWLNTETEYSSLSELDVQPETFDLAHDRMQELGDAGGGIFYEVESLEDLAGAYERVIADLGTVYSIGYRPTNKLRDGKWRAIRVNVSRPNAVARGKRGYYAN